ncbi:MAG: hypothetical protein WA705_08060 [Candidatus Ozemobacteraceae bacterium]
MSVGSVSSASGSNIGELMKLLQSGQNQGVELAKKFIKMSVAEKVSANTAEGKGQLIDVSA